MYVPTSFNVRDQDRLFEFIETHSFGLLVTTGESGPIASHLPLLLDREATQHGRLFGHMARANPQWNNAEGTNACVVFQGPHAYISPSWYMEKNVVPTWNYVAVHVYGTVRIVTEELRLVETLRRTVELYESEMAEPWRVDSPDDEFIASLLNAIVAFEIDITRIEGKWKLSQNHNPQRRQHVIQALRQLEGEDRERIADLMNAELLRQAELQS